MIRSAVLAAVLLAASATGAAAQVLLDVGPVLVGGANAGTLTETYTASDGSAVPQFSLDKSVSRAFGLNTHLTIRLSPRVALEVTGLWARPQLRTKLSGDSDGADNTTATETVDRFVLGGGATVNLRTLGRWHTFARGSFGWLRELSNDQSLYQDGWVAALGGGANYLWKEKRGHFKPAGIRADVWLDVRHGGLAFSEKSRLLAPAISAALVFKL